MTLREMAKHCVPYRYIGGSCATVFGVEVYGSGGRPKWHPVELLFNVFYRWDRFVWAMRHRYQRKHQYYMINTKLPPGYHDIDTRMLHGCMELLVTYVDCHGGPDALDRFTAELRTPNEDSPWEVEATSSQASRQAEATAIYRWWKVDRPANEQAAEDMLMRLYSNTRLGTRPVDVNGETMHEFTGIERTGDDLRLPGDSNEALWELERANDEADQAMLHRLINIRQGLWT